MKSFAGAALLVGLGAGGCALEVEEPATALDEEAAPPESVPAEQEIDGETVMLGPTFTESTLSAHGGSGGSFMGHVTPAAIIYGVRVSSGVVVDRISFAWYQPSRWDNLYQTGDRWGTTPAYGGSGGTDHGWWYCPTGKGVIGIRGSSGTLVDRVGVICGNVTNPDPFSPYNTYSPVWGGSGGSWFGEDRCTPGRIVDSFNVRSGTRLDNLQAICINAH